jgi:anti-sigma factor RsiW
MTEVRKHHRLEDILLYEQSLLERPERAELEKHLRGCADCRATLERARSVLPAVQQALGPDEMSVEELREIVKARMTERSVQRAGTPGPLFTRSRIALLVFGSVAVGAVIVGVQPLLHPARLRSMAPFGLDTGADGGTAGRAMDEVDGGEGVEQCAWH